MEKKFSKAMDLTKENCLELEMALGDLARTAYDYAHHELLDNGICGQLNYERLIKAEEALSNAKLEIARAILVLEEYNPDF